MAFLIHCEFFCLLIEDKFFHFMVIGQMFF